jgi:hypothetical protein
MPNYDDKSRNDEMVLFSGQLFCTLLPFDACKKLCNQCKVEHKDFLVLGYKVLICNSELCLLTYVVEL